MPRRTLAVLGVAAFAGLALPFGLPQMAQAAGPIASISLMPFPIAQPGTLGASATIQMCVQPRDSSGGTVGIGVPVWLSFFSGVFTAPLVQTSTAFVGSTQLNATPVSRPTAASCTSQNGTVSADSVAVTYTSPTAPIPAHGRDVLDGADTSAQPNALTGACPGTNICNSDTYVYSPVTQYVFAPVPPIAPNGSLSAGQVVNFTVTAEDSAGHPAPGAFINLKLNGTASPSGTATAFNHFSGFSKDKITNTPERFGSDGNGTVQVAYTAATATAGTDTITAQDHPLTPTVTATTSYTYGSTVAFTQAPYTAVPPFRICDTRPVAPGITSNPCNTGIGSGPILQNQSRAVKVTGGVIPSTATAIVVNLAAIAPSQGTFVTLYPAPASGTAPKTASVNPQAGAVVSILVEVGIGTGGNIEVYNNRGTTNVTIDIEGYVDSTSPGLFNSTAPTRICDTRPVAPGITSNQCNTGPGSGPIGPNGVLTFNVSASGSPIPSSGVTAVVFNLTAIAPSVRTVLTAYPGDLPSHPTAANINIEAHKALGNRVIVPVPSGCIGATCTVKIWNSVGSVNVAVDVAGWFETGSGSQFTALATPARVCDTRFGGSTQGCSTPGTVGPGLSNVLNINVTGIDGIPDLGSTHSPLALVANVTAVNATTGTFITVYPGNLSPPNAADINVPSFLPVNNLVLVGIDPATGTINLFNDLGNVNLIVDVYGYYS
jgi:hypothetical protein